MLPKEYQWIETIGTLPKMVSAALQYIGVREYPGSNANPVILDMARSIGVSDIYTSDETSWCALFINYLIRITAKPQVDVKGDRYNLLRAKWLLNWGTKVTAGDEKMGDIVIIDRDGGGHVFVLIAKTKAGNYIGIGGNQGNKVSFAEFDKNRVLGIRRFYTTALPGSAKLYVVDGTGQFSTNEA